MLIWGIVLLSANLRPAITGVGPLVEVVTRQTGLASPIAGILTTLPLIAFGLVSPVSPSLVRKFGMERSLFLGLVILSLGTLLRSWGSVSGLMIGMFLVGSGAAIEHKARAFPFLGASQEGVKRVAAVKDARFFFPSARPMAYKAWEMVH